MNPEAEGLEREAVRYRYRARVRASRQCKYYCMRERADKIIVRARRFERARVTYCP